MFISIFYSFSTMDDSLRAEIRHRRFFLSLTRGCFSPLCTNPNCLNSGIIKPSPSEVEEKCQQLVCFKLKISKILIPFFIHKLQYRSKWNPKDIARLRTGCLIILLYQHLMSAISTFYNYLNSTFFTFLFSSVFFTYL